LKEEHEERRKKKKKKMNKKHTSTIKQQQHREDKTKRHNLDTEARVDAQTETNQQNKKKFLTKRAISLLILFKQKLSLEIPRKTTPHKSVFSRKQEEVNLK
jgi:hypothetical protein